MAAPLPARRAYRPVTNASHIIPALKMVFVGAFDPAAATGGIIGGASEAMRYGVARGLFSNEAGMAPPRTPMPSPR